MKKTDLNVLKRLLNEDGIKGKKRLEQFIEQEKKDEQQVVDEIVSFSYHKA